MDHIQIRIQPTSAIHPIQIPKTILKTLRQTRQKVHTDQTVQLLEPGQAEWVLALSARLWRAEARPDTEVSDLAEEHHRLDQEQERVGVERWMFGEDVVRHQTLWIARDDVL